jgi:hypothetical protein
VAWKTPAFSVNTFATLNMDTQIAEEELRSLAYRLWEEAGYLDGRADEFWQRARLQLRVHESPPPADRMNDSDEFVDAPDVPRSGSLAGH